MIQTQKRQKAALPYTALPRRGPARPAGRQNAIEYREEYIDGDGDVNGHTLIHTHTGSIADVDITQSGVYDNMITLTTSGDNHDIDISQTD